MSATDLVEATIDMTTAEAAQITRKIDLRLVTVAENWEAALAYILEAIERKAHLALGYPSPGAYIADKFGNTLSRLSVETRREVSQGLAEAGLSSRAIASVVDVSDRQVRIDVAAGGKSLPTSTTGTDGKTYSKAVVALAPPRERRRPLPTAFEEASYEIERAVRKLKRLQEDDRFGANREALRHLHHRLVSSYEDIHCVAFEIGPSWTPDRVRGGADG